MIKLVLQSLQTTLKQLLKRQLLNNLYSNNLTINHKLLLFLKLKTNKTYLLFKINHKQVINKN